MSNFSLLGLFYILKPLIPRKIQMWFRRKRAAEIRKSTGETFIKNSSEIDFNWLESFKSAVLLTHDIETVKGQQRIPELVEIEKKHGITSCWNFVANRYPVDIDLINHLKSTGHEIGVHGFNHDGKLFSSKSVFQKRLTLIMNAAKEWGAYGFRSPSLLYDEELLKTLPFTWDSSIPAWDPFQPKPGGCGCYYPYKLSDTCVELPVTLWQDFTLFEELQENSIDIWKQQIDAIYEIGGLINVIVHPDYMNELLLKMYSELLEYLQSKKQIWFALPSEISDWFRKTELFNPIPQ